MNIRYEKLPEHMRDGVKLYLEHGIEPGDFLYAVLCNKLVESFGRADTTNRAHMYDWANFLYNEMPIGSWGSEGVVKTWMLAHQESGIPA